MIRFIRERYGQKQSIFIADSTKCVTSVFYLGCKKSGKWILLWCQVSAHFHLSCSDLCTPDAPARVHAARARCWTVKMTRLVYCCEETGVRRHPSHLSLSKIVSLDHWALAVTLTLIVTTNSMCTCRDTFPWGPVMGRHPLLLRDSCSKHLMRKTDFHFFNGCSLVICMVANGFGPQVACGVVVSSLSCTGRHLTKLSG